MRYHILRPWLIHPAYKIQGGPRRKPTTYSASCATMMAGFSSSMTGTSSREDQNGPWRSGKSQHRSCIWELIFGRRS